MIDGSVARSHETEAVNLPGEAPAVTRPRYLYVVSRQHETLYELLLERFQDDSNVEVVLDRRVAAPGDGGPDSSDRRTPSSPDDDLSTRSHLIITRPA